ncbi:putative acylesterase/phospholipase RssA [Kitasatospora sp. MAA4]|uniref:hypothetical protein n=1 Tax=Kitasatospora sp. MAA4 TaxID=3035093 RepID=UPI0024732E64|nr:hypothetical protein [Kitasatospora sp. MAA4]MDH6133265.1 putative acylesterase/phospholipase RssA [Kitasatospora sp. MAA4]
MGSTLVATDKGFDEFAQRLQAFVDDTGDNPFILNLAGIKNGGTKAGLNADGTYDALLTGTTADLAIAGTLSDKYKALCGALYDTFQAMGKSLYTIRVDLHNAKSTLNNAEDDSLTSAQLLQLLQNVLNGSSTTPPVIPPPSTQ